MGRGKSEREGEKKGGECEQEMPSYHFTALVHNRIGLPSLFLLFFPSSVSLFQSPVPQIFFSFIFTTQSVHNPMVAVRFLFKVVLFEGLD